MGVVADLTRQYEQQIDHLRQDNAALYGELSALATHAPSCGKRINSCGRLIARNGRAGATATLHLQMDNLALHRQL